MKSVLRWLKNLRICAWCKCRIGGNPLAKTITHGICSKCRDTFYQP